MINITELTWTFDYVKIDKEFEVTSSRQYVNGKYIGEVSSEEKVMLVSYLALFPNREIARVKLGSDNKLNSLYTLYYFDKNHIDKKFIGVFSFSEFNTQQPFISGLEEEMMWRVFEEFADKFPNLFSSEDNYYELNELMDYYDWMDKLIYEYYQKWEENKEKFYGKRNEELRNSLAATFSSISGPKIQEIKGNKPPKRMKIDLNRTKPKEISSEPEPNEVIKLSIEGNKIKPEVDYIQKILSMEDGNTKKNYSNITRSWELQLINEFGHPLTGVCRFKNGEYIEPETDDFKVQGLEAMSYSVLTTLVGREHMNLSSIKAGISGNGNEFLLFTNIKFKESKLLLIMSVINTNEDGKNLSELIGGERDTLEKIAFYLSTQVDWFEKSEFKIKNGTEEVVSLFYRECRKYFKQIQ